MRRFIAVFAALALVALVAAPAMAAPGIKFTTQLTEDGNVVAGAGTVASPWIITTGGATGVMHGLGTMGTVSHPALVGTYAVSGSYPFFLQASPTQQATLLAYFTAKLWPSSYLAHMALQLAGDPSAPFFIVGYPGPASPTSLWLQDGFSSWIDSLTGALGMSQLQIDDDYPVGIYSYTGVLMAKNHTSIPFTFVMQVVRGT
jgi:hypothetical protein